MINFVIPSVGRESLRYSLESLINQTNTNWNCIVGFDGKSKEDIDPSILINDERIEYLYFSEKKGETGFHGNAGLVRNSIIDKIHNSMEWVGFLDDDDTLSKFYVELLEYELTKNQFDCCVFRMRYDNDNQKVLPPFDMNHLQQNYVGISFCVNRSFVCSKGIKFKNDNAEDFKYLKEIYDNDGKIHLSNHIAYNVNGYTYGKK